MARFFYIVLLTIITFQTSFAQDFDTRKDYLKSSVWSGLGVSYLFSDSSHFFYQNQYRFSNNFTGLNENSFLTKDLYRIHNWLGYLYRPTKYWGLAASEKMVHQNKSTSFFTRFDVEHTWYVDNISITKGVAFEWLSDPNSLDIGRVNFFVRVPMNFYLSGKLFNIIPSYTAFVNFDMNGDGVNPFFDRRKIDMGRLRLDIAYYLTEKWSLSIFFMTETWFQFSLASFDANGFQIKPDENLNRIIPTVGVNINYFIKP